MQQMAARSTARRACPATASREVAVREEGPSLIKGQSHDAILATASAGKNNMPAFKSIYSADELNDVTAYIQATLQGTR